MSPVDTAEMRSLATALTLEQAANDIRVFHPTTTNDDGQVVCASCVSMGEPDIWPCPTMTYLAAALSGGTEQ